MNREEYLEKVTEKIRCKKACPMIRKELMAHMEDQKEAYLSEGMEDEVAERKAVIEMGDPYVVGEKMDLIHRPQKDPVLLLMAIGMACFGIIMQMLIFPGMDNSVIEQFYWVKTLGYHGIGISVMFAFIYLDYRYLEMHLFKIYGAYLALAVLFSFTEPGSYYQSMTRNNGFYMLFVPLFAAFVYHFRNEGFRGIGKTVGILLIQLLVFGRIGNYSSAVLMVIMLSCATVLLCATGKGVFGGRRGWQFGILLSTILFPLVSLTADIMANEGAIFHVPDYIVHRIKAMLAFSEHAETYGYTISLARQQVQNASLFGGGNLGSLGDLSGAYSDYIITCAFSYFGFGIVMMLLLVVGLFLARSIKISMSQKNHFGMLLALGCSMLLAFKSGFYVLTNLGLFLGTSIDMPFMSYGFWCTVVNYILLGMILSVHRYSMVVDEMPKIKYRLVKEEIK